MADARRRRAGRGRGRERCRGLLADDADYRAVFERPPARDLPMPFERARTQLALGERLRRSKQRAEAREPLTAALDEFERLGARPWAERARTELRATGGPAGASAAPRPPPSSSPRTSSRSPCSSPRA